MRRYWIGFCASVMVWPVAGFAEPVVVQGRSIESCLFQPELQKQRAAELQEMVKADQAIREKWEGNWENMTQEDLELMLEEDLARRKRVGEIMGEGCFKTPTDYAAASLIYQHGDAPDHYFQAYIWANRAVDLGDVKKKRLVALTIDRYLTSIGKKQLFGSQAMLSDKTDGCFCLFQIEKMYPDDLRKEYSSLSLQERFDWVHNELNAAKYCPELECRDDLQPSPKGTIPGFW